MRESFAFNRKWPLYKSKEVAHQLPKRTRKNAKTVVKKKCPICGKEKNISTGFYKSMSPLYSEDGCVPICTVCVKNGVLNVDGTIDFKKLKNMSQKIDKPFFVDSLDSAYKEFRRSHGYLSDDEVARHGRDILGIYFKNIMLPQNRHMCFADSERDGFIHRASSLPKAERDRIISTYIKNEGYQKTIDSASSDAPIETTLKFNEIDGEKFEVTPEIISLFGEGYTTDEYRKMYRKYETLKMNYSLQTSLHQEALATYVRFKVKEEDATARGEVTEAKKWYDAAQSAAENGKLTPRQLSQSDLHGGINSFSEIFKAVEQAVDIIPILPTFKYRPNDALDFVIWCYINYARDLQGLPQCSYEDVYKFYDKKKEEYVSQYGDPYGIFDDEPDESLRDNIMKFITLPSDYGDGET